MKTASFKTSFLLIALILGLTMACGSSGVGTEIVTYEGDVDWGDNLIDSLAALFFHCGEAEVDHHNFDENDDILDLGFVLDSPNSGSGQGEVSDDEKQANHNKCLNGCRALLEFFPNANLADEIVKYAREENSEALGDLIIRLCGLS